MRFTEDVCRIGEAAAEQPGWAAGSTALGGLYAGRFGMTVVSARIMVFRDLADGPLPSLRSWLSPDDMARLVLATLTTTATGHHVVWGVSRNTRRVVDLAPGLAIGFDPQDDAEAHADAAQLLEPSGPPGMLGGGFADPGYLLGEPHGGRFGWT